MSGRRPRSGSRSSPFSNALSIALLFSVVTTAVVLTQDSPVGEQKDRLAELRSRIEQGNRVIAELERKRSQKARLADVARAQATALDSILQELQRSEREMARTQIHLRRELDSLTAARADLIKTYREGARALYRTSLMTPASSALLLPKEQQRLALAERFFHRYTLHQAARGRRIQELREELRHRDSLLEVKRSRQLQMMSEKQSHHEELQRLQKRHEQALASFISKKKEVADALQQQQREARQLENLIRQAAENARRDKERERRRAQQEASANPPRATTKPPAPRSAVTAFSPAWPTSNTSILHGYGERRNRQTNTVTMNPGINIRASSGDPARAAEGGKVSLVSWLPGYGTIVVVEHDGDWRTVYANLASAAVSEGATVKRGETIGHVGSSIDGEYLHFQVWQGRDRHDPASLLP